MIEPMTDRRLAIWQSAAGAPARHVDIPRDEFEALLARLDAAEAERDRLQAEVEELKAPDMFWDGDDDYPRHDWTDALDGAPSMTVVELRTARDLGNRFAVYIPQSAHDPDRWHECCHLFNSLGDAEAAIAAAATPPGAAP